MSDPRDEAAPSPASLFRTFGIILGTENYAVCLAFYRDVLGPPVWFEKPGLCCLPFGQGYLMIETGGLACPSPKPDSEIPTISRFNVDDVSEAADQLEAKGIRVERKKSYVAKSVLSPTPTATCVSSRTQAIRSLRCEWKRRPRRRHRLYPPPQLQGRRDPKREVGTIRIAGKETLFAITYAAAGQVALASSRLGEDDEVRVELAQGGKVLLKPERRKFTASGQKGGQAKSYSRK